MYSLKHEIYWRSTLYLVAWLFCRCIARQRDRETYRRQPARHNRGIWFIATKCKVLTLVFYLTNYATKAEDPVWKRAAVAKEILEILGGRVAHGESYSEGIFTNDDGKENKICQLLMRVANRVFTERALLQVEVAAYLLGYPIELQAAMPGHF
jgi:hypothetical protein